MNLNYNVRSDKQLVALYIKGDDLAAQILVCRYRQLLYSIGRKSGLKDEDCGDVIQDVWLKFQENPKALRDHRKIRSWLAIVMKNRSVRWWEKHKANIVPEQEAECVHDPGQLLDEVAEWAQERQIVREVLEKWPSRCRTLLTGLFFDDLSYDAVADLLGVSPHGIGARLGRCLGEFKLALLKRGVTC